MIVIKNSFDINSCIFILSKENMIKNHDFSPIKCIVRGVIFNGTYEGMVSNETNISYKLLCVSTGEVFFRSEDQLMNEATAINKSIVLLKELLKSYIDQPDIRTKIHRRLDILEKRKLNPYWNNKL